MALAITYTQRQEFERRIRTRKARAEDVRRARVIVMLADDVPYTAIAQAVACHPSYIGRWKQRFEADGLEGLRARYRGQPPRVRTPQLEARLLEKTRQAPPDAMLGGRSTRGSATALGTDGWERTAGEEVHLQQIADGGITRQPGSRILHDGRRGELKGTSSDDGARGAMQEQLTSVASGARVGGEP